MPSAPIPVGRASLPGCEMRAPMNLSAFWTKQADVPHRRKNSRDRLAKKVSLLAIVDFIKLHTYIHTHTKRIGILRIDWILRSYQTINCILIFMRFSYYDRNFTIFKELTSQPMLLPFRFLAAKPAPAQPSTCATKGQGGCSSH